MASRYGASPLLGLLGTISGLIYSFGQLSKVPAVVHTTTHIAFRAYSQHDLDAAFSIGLRAND